MNHLFDGGTPTIYFALRMHRGSTMDSHRLIYLAGQQGLDKQNSLVEELFRGYFTEGKFISDK